MLKMNYLNLIFLNYNYLQMKNEMNLYLNLKLDLDLDFEMKKLLKMIVKKKSQLLINDHL